LAYQNVALMQEAPLNRSAGRCRALAAAAIVLLTIVLALLTARRTFTAPLWGDEMRTWRDGIEKPLATVLAWHHNPDHAPIGHLLARGGATLFGVEHAWALRLGSWLCGLLCVPAIWWLGRTLWDDTVGLAMAVMATIDPNLCFQMTQARMYAPLLLTVIVSLTLVGMILVRHERSWGRQMSLGVAAGIAMGVGIWTHAQIYAVLIAALLTALAMVARRSPRRAGVALIVAIVVAGSIGAPGIRKIASRHDAEQVVNADVTDAPGGQLEDAIHKLTGKAWITYAILACVVGGHAIVLANRSATHRWVVVMLTLLVIIAVVNLLIAARYRAVAHARYLTVIEPALWFSVALVVVDLFRTHRKHGGAAAIGAWAALIAWVGLCGYQTTRIDESQEIHPLAQPFADAARLIRASIAPGDRFVMVARSPYGMYTRYYGLSLDDSIDDALKAYPTARAARLATNEAKLDRGVVWLLCVTPPPNIQYRFPLDEPTRAVQMIADSRHIEAGSLDALKRTDRWHAAALRIDADHIEIRAVYP
jgi:uncharacterized membrane protein